jgi:hypothetical protein
MPWLRMQDWYDAMPGRLGDLIALAESMILPRFIIFESSAAVRHGAFYTYLAYEVPDEEVRAYRQQPQIGITVAPKDLLKPTPENMLKMDEILRVAAVVQAMRERTGTGASTPGGMRGDFKIHGDAKPGKTGLYPTGKP